MMIPTGNSILLCMAHSLLTDLHCHNTIPLCTKSAQMSQLDSTTPLDTDWLYQRAKLPFQLDSSALLDTDSRWLRLSPQGNSSPLCIHHSQLTVPHCHSTTQLCTSSVQRSRRDSSTLLDTHSSSLILFH